MASAPASSGASAAPLPDAILVRRLDGAVFEVSLKDQIETSRLMSVAVNSDVFSVQKGRPFARDDLPCIALLSMCARFQPTLIVGSSVPLLWRLMLVLRLFLPPLLMT